MQSPTIHDEPIPSPETCCICGDIDDIIVDDDDNHNNNLGGGGGLISTGVGGVDVGGVGIDGGGGVGGGSMMMGGSAIPTPRSHHHNQHHHSGRIQFTTTKRTAASKNLCSIIFQLYGSVWLSVFPYCVLNCSIMFILEFLQEFYNIEFAFSLTGHQLMTLMISFLIISKVNLSYDRYMNARSSIGHALLLLRELNQSITMMATNNPKNYNTTTTNEMNPRGSSSSQQHEGGGGGGSNDGGQTNRPKRSGASGSQRESAAASAAAAEDSSRRWRVEATNKILDLVDSTIRMVKDEGQAHYLARNELDYNPIVRRRNLQYQRKQRKHQQEQVARWKQQQQEQQLRHRQQQQQQQPIQLNGIDSNLLNQQQQQHVHVPYYSNDHHGVGDYDNDDDDDDDYYYDDPMLHVNTLRLHIYRDRRLAACTDNFERFKMIEQLNDFSTHYRDLLKIASTSLPFPLIQMARTFLFLWVFTIPFVLRGVINEIYVGMLFVFFLTYGFIGLEIVSMKLMFPFGDGVDDLNVTGMRQATILGIRNDLKLFGESTAIANRRLEDNTFARQQTTGNWKAPWLRPPMVNTNMYVQPSFSTDTDVTPNSHRGDDGSFSAGMTPTTLYRKFGNV